ncbi:hypothetical protein BJ878DRAFT_578322 [Calycina marina]|uniref:Transaldolase n=1 Tax=Calycina marina TaxID=1763456 RepID=A0A9P7YY18_9HELO|nr:hypothetical protein BJ878DRAFT_578322 [Calycina marina]
MPPNVNLLAYLQSKTQIDCDSLSLDVLASYDHFVDCTSNQADSYYEFLNEGRYDLLQKSVAFARGIYHEFPGVTLEEFAVEVSMVTVSLTAIPFIRGNIHVMANPSLAYSTPKIVENAKRISNLCHRWDPEFDLSRLVIKVPATWEGLQACRELTSTGINTLATTLFTIEQAILAAEAGCISISPFVHELKVHFDETYHDVDPIFELCLEAQQYFEQYSYTTRVKACSLIDVEEVMKLAGIAALTLPPGLMSGLRDTEDSEDEVFNLSIFDHKTDDSQASKRLSFIDDEAKFREAFSQRENGKGQSKTNQAIELFCGFQTKAENLLRGLLDQQRHDGLTKGVQEEALEQTQKTLIGA